MVAWRVGQRDHQRVEWMVGLTVQQKVEERAAQMVVQ